MQENAMLAKSNRLATIQFFTFQLEAPTLKKLLDLYVWFNIFSLVVLYFIHVLKPTSVNETIVWFIASIIIGFCCYFFRYSVIFHCISSFCLSLSIIDCSKGFLAIAYNADIISKLAGIKVGIMNHLLHEFIVDNLGHQIVDLFSVLIINSIVIYFAYSYKKLLKVQQ